MDTITPAQRSITMSHIRSKNTTPELVVRSWLHRNGFRFRLHAKSLPGHPDIVLAKHKTVVEVRGCFWHRHGCGKSSVPKTNRKFWNAKFRRNTARDAKQEERLGELGWRLIVVWECELTPRGRVATLTRLCEDIRVPRRVEPERLVAEAASHYRV